MKLSELAASFGVESYPEKYEEVYASLNSDAKKIFTREYLTAVENKYGCFKQHFENLVRGGEAILENEALATWIAVIAEFNKVSPLAELKLGGTTFPTNIEGAGADMMRIFPLIALMERTAELFYAHGFNFEEVSGIYNVFEISLRLSETTLHRPGLTATYYGWTLVYMKCEMFDCGSFNFQFKKYENKFLILREKKSGELVALATEGRFHRDGKTLGDAGFTDEEGAFDAELVETESEFIANPVKNACVIAEKAIFKKADYEVALREGDDVIGLHIPRNVDFSDEAIDESLKNGWKIALERFPEYSPKLLMCSSWLLDPGLEALLGEQSRIVKFGKRFLRFPGGASNGRGGYSFVFLGYEENENLPEDTSLRRKLKAHYLGGGYTYFVPGVIASEDYK
jgi:hypothetical protein